MHRSIIFPQRLSYLRKRAGISQKQLGAAIGSLEVAGEGGHIGPPLQGVFLIGGQFWER